MILDFILTNPSLYLVILSLHFTIQFFFHHGIKDKKVIVTFCLTFMTFFLAVASLYFTILLFISEMQETIRILR